MSLRYKRIERGTETYATRYKINVFEGNVLLGYIKIELFTKPGYLDVHYEKINEEDLIDQPFIDYVNVYRQGVGIGTSLYIEAAKWMAELGYSLRSGTIQSHEASMLWKSMIRKGLPISTKKIAIRCLGLSYKKVYVLDYRKYAW